MMDNQDAQSVTQEDREVAADIWRGYIAKVGEIIVERQMRAGGLDEGLPAILAAHRRASQPTSAEDAVAWLYEQPNLIDADGSVRKRLSPSRWSEGRRKNWTETALGPIASRPTPDTQTAATVQELKRDRLVDALRGNLTPIIVWDQLWKDYKPRNQEEADRLAQGKAARDDAIDHILAALSSKAVEPAPEQTAAIGAMREAFKAGWRTNAVGEETHPASYLDNCEQGDWEEYQRVGLDAYVAALSQPVAAPQAETDWDDGKSYSPVQAKDRVRLWFFRDLSSEQRLMLFSLFQMPVDEIGEFHGIQKLALNRVIGQCAPPQPEGGTVEKVARILCEQDGCDPDDDVIAGQAAAFENYGPRWQAMQRSEGQCGGRDYVAEAQAILAALTPEKSNG